MVSIDPTKLAVLDAIRTLLWWTLVVAATGLGLYYKRRGSRKGWRLWLGIYGCIICQAAYMTMWAAHNSAVRSLGYGPTTDTLYRICIPLYQLAMASFMVGAAAGGCAGASGGVVVWSVQSCFETPVLLCEHECVSAQPTRTGSQDCRELEAVKTFLAMFMLWCC